jgi:antirestriction protein ArdC
VESWLKVTKEDKRAIFQAASYATQAANFVIAKATPELAPKPEALTPRQVSEQPLGDPIAF